MDAGHRRELLAAGADPDRVWMFRQVDPVDPGADVPDPYYGGPDGFEEVLAMVERTVCGAGRAAGAAARGARFTPTSGRPGRR